MHQFYIILWYGLRERTFYFNLVKHKQTFSLGNYIQYV